jgi:hypothetical protein
MREVVQINMREQHVAESGRQENEVHVNAHEIVFEAHPFSTLTFKLTVP